MSDGNRRAGDALGISIGSGDFAVGRDPLESNVRRLTRAFVPRNAGSTPLDRVLIPLDSFPVSRT